MKWTYMSKQHYWSTNLEMENRKCKPPQFMVVITSPVISPWPGSSTFPDSSPWKVSTSPSSCPSRLESRWREHWSWDSWGTPVMQLLGRYVWRTSQNRLITKSLEGLGCDRSGWGRVTFRQASHPPKVAFSGVLSCRRIFLVRASRSKDGQSYDVF